MFEDARDVSRGVQFVKPRWLFLCKCEGRMVEFVDCKVEKYLALSHTHLAWKYEYLFNYIR